MLYPHRTMRRFVAIVDCSGLHAADWVAPASPGSRVTSSGGLPRFGFVCEELFAICKIEISLGPGSCRRCRAMTHANAVVVGTLRRAAPVVRARSSEGCLGMVRVLHRGGRLSGPEKKASHDQDVLDARWPVRSPGRAGFRLRPSCAARGAAGRWNQAGRVEWVFDRCRLPAERRRRLQERLLRRDQSVCERVRRWPVRRARLPRRRLYRPGD
jgi:hypothetical protein